MAGIEINPGSPVLVYVKIFAKVPYLQHYYDTRCLDEESYVLERVAEHGN